MKSTTAPIWPTSRRSTWRTCATRKTARCRRSNAALSNDELAAVTTAIRGSVAPRDMCVLIRYMAPSMSFAERLDMLGGMRAGAPPPVFEMFRKAARASLPEREYQAIAAAAGFV